MINMTLYDVRIDDDDVGAISSRLNKAKKLKNKKVKPSFRCIPGFTCVRQLESLFEKSKTIFV